MIRGGVYLGGRDVSVWDYGWEGTADGERRECVYFGDCCIDPTHEEYDILDALNDSDLTLVHP